MTKKDWNEQAARNNNLSSADLKYEREMDDRVEFSEEVADGLERDQMVKQQAQKVKDDR